MPRIVHEPWCETHYAGEDVCATRLEEFGPPECGWPDGTPMPVGGLGCEKQADEAVRVFIEYRTQGGLMDVDALRAVREAVADDARLFLVVLDELIDKMGDAVPPARRARQPERTG